MTLNYLFDENISSRHCKILQMLHAPLRFEHIGDLGLRGVKDPDLIDSISRMIPAPVFVSADIRMLRREAERDLFLRHGLCAIFLTNTVMNLRDWEKAWRLIKMWPAFHKLMNREAVSTTVLTVDLKNYRIKIL